MKKTMGRLLIGILGVYSVGCSNANVSVTGLKGAGAAETTAPGFDTGGAVSSVVNGTFNVKGKINSYQTATTVNGPFTVTGEVVR